MIGRHPREIFQEKLPKGHSNVFAPLILASSRMPIFRHNWHIHDSGKTGMVVANLMRTKMSSSN